MLSGSRWSSGFYSICCLPSLPLLSVSVGILFLRAWGQLLAWTRLDWAELVYFILFSVLAYFRVNTFLHSYQLYLDFSFIGTERKKFAVFGSILLHFSIF